MAKLCQQKKNKISTLSAEHAHQEKVIWPAELKNTANIVKTMNLGEYMGKLFSSKYLYIGISNNLLQLVMINML